MVIISYIIRILCTSASDCLEDHVSSGTLNLTHSPSWGAYRIAGLIKGYFAAHGLSRAPRWKSAEKHQLRNTLHCRCGLPVDMGPCRSRFHRRSSSSSTCRSAAVWTWSGSTCHGWAWSSWTGSTRGTAAWCCGATPPSGSAGRASGRSWRPAPLSSAWWTNTSYGGRSGPTSTRPTTSWTLLLVLCARARAIALIVGSRRGACRANEMNSNWSELTQLSELKCQFVQFVQSVQCNWNQFSWVASYTL